MSDLRLTMATSALEAQSITRNQVSKQDPSKLEKSAQDFESLLLGHWLEQAQQSFATVPGADEDGSDEASDPGKSQFQALNMQALARQISKAGGLGIAKMITHQLQKQTEGSVAPPGEEPPKLMRP